VSVRAINECLKEILRSTSVWSGSFISSILIFSDSVVGMIRFDLTVGIHGWSYLSSQDCFGSGNCCSSYSFSFIRLSGSFIAEMSFSTLFSIIRNSLS